MINNAKIAIVIPCYKVENHIAEVLDSIPVVVDYIIAVNDKSPDSSLRILQENASKNPKLIIVSHEINQGVGGAMVTGFKKALELDVDIIIKIDGDGQMDTKYIPSFIQPILEKQADFTKGNRFKNPKTIRNMPIVRRIGNIGLSFMTKAASGYWNIFDPTNGYFAISRETLEMLDLNKLHKRYFFESSLIIQLYYTDAVIKDIPIDAKYGNEVSNLSITKTLFEFPPKLFRAFCKRILLKYFLYDFNIGSIYLLSGIPLFSMGLLYGLINFIKYSKAHIAAPSGTVVIPSLFITIGFQLLIAAINFDVTNYPKKNN